MSTHSTWHDTHVYVFSSESVPLYDDDDDDEASICKKEETKPQIPYILVTLQIWRTVLTCL